MKAKNPPSTSNFVKVAIKNDLESGAFNKRRWNGKPGTLSEHQEASLDEAKIRTRFPPEPNGYLHIGHAKSICLNFGLAKEYGGICHLRFDDTNPATEEHEYVDSIRESVKWLGFDWSHHEYFSSDYFDRLYEFAKALICADLAYVDSLDADQMRLYRGTLTEPGKNSPFRVRPKDASLMLFSEMKEGKHPDGAHVLRLKINMASPNVNLRDPVAYRIKHGSHHRTGDTWPIYPSYDFTHGVSDALENITHSICTLEFEDHRPLYDWLNQKLLELGFLQKPLPQQIEFARLNLSHVILSKRKLIQLVKEKHVEGWDDPRMPTLVGARRRGYSPEGLRLFTDRIGVSKADSWIDYTILEDCMRETLNESSLRKIAVLNPIKLIIENFKSDYTEICHAPNHPQKKELGKRDVSLSRELWIEKEDFSENPSKGYFRLFVGNTVRLRYGYVIKCTGFERDKQGSVKTVLCEYFPDSKSGSPGADTYKVKGNIHWVDANSSIKAAVILYDRLFATEHPGENGDFIADLNTNSKKTIEVQIESSAAEANKGECFQFERHGYFTVDSSSETGNLVFNRTVTLRDSWKK
ncbi:MAG: glutamine--tRNA ligase/YqeY domain fusion protein [Burkholderiales bacterium]